MEQVTNKDNKAYIASVILSRLTEPMLLTPAILWITTGMLRLSNWDRLIDFTLMTIFAWIIPVSSHVYWMAYKKEVDIDITEREKRFKLAAVPMVSTAISVVFAYYIDKSFFVLILATFIPILSLIGITVLTKISYHTGVNTTWYCTINYVYGGKFWWLFLFLIPIIWARIILKKHSAKQLSLGIMVCSFLFSVSLILLKGLFR